MTNLPDIWIYQILVGYIYTLPPLFGGNTHWISIFPPFCHLYLSTFCSSHLFTLQPPSSTPAAPPWLLHPCLSSTLVSFLLLPIVPFSFFSLPFRLHQLLLLFFSACFPSLVSTGHACLPPWLTSNPKDVTPNSVCSPRESHRFAGRR